MYREHWTVEKVPTWAIGYMVNGDPTGLEDDEIKEIDEWMGKYKACVVEPKGEPYFTRHIMILAASEEGSGIIYKWAMYQDMMDVMLFIRELMADR